LVTSIDRALRNMYEQSLRVRLTMLAEKGGEPIGRHMPPEANHRQQGLRIDFGYRRSGGDPSTKHHEVDRSWIKPTSDDGHVSCPSGCIASVVQPDDRVVDDALAAADQ
jgi:hypothetical protein